MKRFFFLFPLFALLTGCTAGKGAELSQNAGELLPVSALAIDADENGYRMTVESIRQDSLDGDAEPAYFSVAADDFDRLFALADELLASRLYLSHAQVILISPAIAEHALPTLTDSLLRRSDARLTLRIAVAHKAAPDTLLCADAATENIPGVALAALLDRRASDGTLADCPLFRILDRQMRGEPFSLPVLCQNEDGHTAPDGSVTIANGTLRFREGGLPHA